MVERTLNKRQIEAYPEVIKRPLPAFIDIFLKKKNQNTISWSLHAVAPTTTYSDSGSLGPLKDI